MIRATIDIGSNSTLLLAAEFNELEGRIERELLNLSYITSLGKDLDKNQMFHPDSMQATYEALADYKKQLVKLGIESKNVLVTATEAARVAKNSSEFFHKIKNELGFSITIITSEGEAYYTALGVVSDSKIVGQVVIMDIGGASTELIKVEMKPFQIIKSVSLPVGSVRASDWMKENIFDKKMNDIFSNDFKYYQTSTLICVAGGMTSLATMYLGQSEFDARKIDGMNISFEAFLAFSSDLQKTSKENLQMLFPFLGKRVEVISAASKVAEQFAKYLGINAIQISTRGLRYGTLLRGVIDEQFISR